MLDVYFTPQIKVKEKAPPVLPTPAGPPGEPGGQYKSRTNYIVPPDPGKSNSPGIFMPKISRSLLRTWIETCPKIGIKPLKTGGTYEKTSRWALPAQDHAAGRHAKARLRHKPGGGKPQSQGNLTRLRDRHRSL